MFCINKLNADIQCRHSNKLYVDIPIYINIDPHNMPEYVSGQEEYLKVKNLLLLGRAKGDMEKTIIQRRMLKGFKNMSNFEIQKFIIYLWKGSHVPFCPP